MVYLVSYTLHKPGQDYTDLHKAIKEVSGTWWKHTTSAWLADASVSAKQIFDRIVPYVDKNDDLMVFRLQGEWHGRTADSTNYDWLNARQF